MTADSSPHSVQDDFKCVREGIDPGHPTVFFDAVDRIEEQLEAARAQSRESSEMYVRCNEQLGELQQQQSFMQRKLVAQGAYIRELENDLNEAGGELVEERQWSNLCPACKGYPDQAHRYDETCKVSTQMRLLACTGDVVSEIRRLTAEETERIRRTPGFSGHLICGMVIGSSWHEPVACAYPPDHTGDHSWASIPQFDPAKEPVVGTPEPDYSGYGTRQEMRKEIVFLQGERRRLEEQLQAAQENLERQTTSMSATLSKQVRVNERLEEQLEALRLAVEDHRDEGCTKCRDTLAKMESAVAEGAATSGPPEESGADSNPASRSDA